MAGMYVLDPAPHVRLAPYDFIATSARRTDEGITADVRVVNGVPKWGDAIIISTEMGRNAAAMRITSSIPALESLAASGALLQLLAQTEAALRKATLTPEWQAPAPFGTFVPPPFPITAIPVPGLQRFIQEVSRAYETPNDFAAMGVLSALSGAIGNRRRLHIVGEIYVSACLWIVVVGKPGVGKSEPLEKAMKPLRDLQDRYIKEYSALKEQYDADLADWESQKKEDRGEKPQPPNASRVLVSDVTMESVALDLLQNPLGVVLYRDELAAFLAGFDKYRAAGSGSDRANWLETWSGKTIDISRKTGMRVIYVPHPFVTIVGTIQPDRLQELLGAMDDGFADRLLTVYPAATVPGLPERSINLLTMAGYQVLIERLLEMQQTDEGRPYVSELSPAALHRFRDRGKALTETLRDDSLPPSLAGTFAKLRIYASRLTHVLHQAAVAANITDAAVVDPEFVDGAWDLVAYFQDHARIVHAAKLSDPEMLRADQILELVARKGWASFNRRQVYMYLPTRFPRPEAAEPALKLLIDHGYIREKPMPEHTGRGRPPTQAYDVNPLWDSHCSQIHNNVVVPAPVQADAADLEMDQFLVDGEVF